MKNIEIKGKFREIDLFFDGEEDYCSVMAKGNEVKSIVLKLDSDVEVLEWNSKKLNFGCGEDYREGWVNMDCHSKLKSDIKHDFNIFPYPFEDNTFDEILASHILEHLKEPIKVLQELKRISKDKAHIKIFVPHAYSYAQISDLQHRNFFCEHTFSLQHLEEYELKDFELVENTFIFKNKYKKFIPFKGFFKIYFNGIYDDMYFEFVVSKNKCVEDEVNESGS